MYGRQSSSDLRDVPLRKDNKIWLLGKEADWSENGGKRFEGGEAEEPDGVKAKDETLDDPGDDDCITVDMRPPAHGDRRDMGAEGLERVAFLLHLLRFTAHGKTILSDWRREICSATQKWVFSAHHAIFFVACHVI